MTALVALLKDRKRAQRGSVLSGVLIMTAFVAIISGALMTELSTNFLLSRVLLNRVAAESTVNSATELAISQLQTTPLIAGCPSLGVASLNGLTAAVTYAGCKPVVDSRSPQFVKVASSSAYNVDGFHAIIPRAGADFYIVGSSSGYVSQFEFGSTAPLWSEHLGGSVSAPPLVMPDLGDSDAGDIANLIPLSVSSNPPPGCQAGGCVALLAQDVGSSPDGECYMAANGPVTTQPAQAVNHPTVVFFGDQTGALFAYIATEAGNCASLATAASDGQPVVAGPLVFPGPVNGNTRSDEVYAVTSDGSSSFLRRYTYTTKPNEAPSLTEVSSLGLPASNARGLAVDSETLPAQVAVSFGSGTLAVVQLQTGFGMQTVAIGAVGSAVSDAPYWCHCPGGANLIAVAGTNGGLFLLNPSLAVQATLPAGGPSIVTSPNTDSVGDWFFGAADGYVHEVQQVAGQSSLIQVATFGPFGSSVTSSVQVGGCPVGICIYSGTLGGTADLVSLDARDATFTSCISAAPPLCSGANPRLRASVEVGVAGSPGTVHVEGWSYYSG
jgi:hypothetical protein